MRGKGEGLVSHFIPFPLTADILPCPGSSNCRWPLCYIGIPLAESIECFPALNRLCLVLQESGPWDKSDSHIIKKYPPESDFIRLFGGCHHR